MYNYQDFTSKNLLHFHNIVNITFKAKPSGYNWSYYSGRVVQIIIIGNKYHNQYFRYASLSQEGVGGVLECLRKSCIVGLSLKGKRGLYLYDLDKFGIKFDYETIWVTRKKDLYYKSEEDENRIKEYNLHY